MVSPTPPAGRLPGCQRSAGGTAGRGEAHEGASEGKGAEAAGSAHHRHRPPPRCRLAAHTHTPPTYRARRSPIAAAPRGEGGGRTTAPEKACPRQTSPSVPGERGRSAPRQAPPGGAVVSPGLIPGSVPPVRRVLVWPNAAGALFCSSPIHERRLRPVPRASAAAPLCVAVAVRKLLKPPVRRGAALEWGGRNGCGQRRCSARVRGGEGGSSAPGRRRRWQRPGARDQALESGGAPYRRLLSPFPRNFGRGPAPSPGKGDLPARSPQNGARA